jgi:hypothetical protein
MDIGDALRLRRGALQNWAAGGGEETLCLGLVEGAAAEEEEASLNGLFESATASALDAAAVAEASPAAAGAIFLADLGGIDARQGREKTRAM